jgi:integrase
MKQEWTALRGIFVHGIDLGFVSPNLLPMLKHEKNKVEKRPAFTAEEYRRLWLFMRQWIKQTNNPRVTADRQLLRDYVLIMANTGMRKGEARQIKWRDVIPHQTEHGEWMTIQVNRGKTGERLVVCQPGTDRYFNRLRKRGHNTEPDDLVFCHADGLPIQEFTGFAALLKAASLRTDSKGDNHTIYSLRHTYATLRLQNGTNVYWLKKNMGTSVAQIEAHYGQTNVLVGIEFETAKRKKQKKTGDAITIKDVPKQPIKMDEIVPVGAVDLTPADDGDDE